MATSSLNRSRTLAMASVAVLLCASCGEHLPDGVVELRYMAWGNPQQLALEQSLCRQFTAQNPSIRVKFVRVPSAEYQNKLVLMLASHTAPDVMRIDHYNFPAQVKKDYFEDLTPYAKADKSFHEEDFFPTALSEDKYRGRLYALSVLFGGVMLSYNKNLVKAAGLEDPYLVWKRGDWTWDRFREYARKMTVKGTPRSTGPVSLIRNTDPVVSDQLFAGARLRRGDPWIGRPSASRLSCRHDRLEHVARDGDHRQVRPDRLAGCERRLSV